MKNFSIAIDGPAGAGKSTIARLLAKKLNYIYIDTGAMYRTIGYYFIKNNLDLNNEEIVNKNLETISIVITYQDGIQQLILNDENVTNFIRTDEVGQAASIVSTYKLVREKLVMLQQNMAKTSSVVMDGRDIGTVVLPNATVKVFLTASTKERAKRRYKEFIEKGMEADVLEIEKEIIERDYRDTHRENSPLKQAEDAILIDSSNMTIEEVVKEILNLCDEKMKVIE